MGSSSDPAAPSALIGEYRRLADVYGQSVEDGRHRRANKALDDLLSIRRAIRAAGPEATERLIALLHDDNLFVRLAAGIDALELAPDDGVRVLEAIAALPRGMASLEAKMTLQQWRKGEFTVPWWEP